MTLKPIVNLCASALVLASIANAQVFDVRTFGARLDGRTNDRAAFVAAIDAASSAGQGVVYIPVGRLIIYADLSHGGEIALPNNITIAGEGEQSIIQMKPDTLAGNVYLFNAGQGRSVSFRNIMFIGPPPTGKFISLAVANYGSTTRFDGVTFERWTEPVKAFSSYGPGNFYVNNCYFHNITGQTLKPSMDSGEVMVTNTRFVKCGTSKLDQVMYLGNNRIATHVSGCLFDSLSGSAIGRNEYGTPGNSPVLFTGNSVRNSVRGVETGTSEYTNSVISGCSFYKVNVPIYVEGGQTVISGCRFAFSTTAIGTLSGYQTLTIDGCEFTGSSEADIYLRGDSGLVSITNGVFRESSGTMANVAVSPNKKYFGIVDNCIFWKNSMPYGNIYLRGAGDWKFTNCDFFGSVQGSNIDALANKPMNVSVYNCRLEASPNQAAVSGDTLVTLHGGNNCFVSSIHLKTINGCNNQMKNSFGVGPSIQSASTIVFNNWNYDTFHIVGILQTDSISAASCLSGAGNARLFFIADDGWSISSTKNIVPKTTGPRKVGSVVSLLFDQTTNRWFEI